MFGIDLKDTIPNSHIQVQVKALQKKVHMGFDIGDEKSRSRSSEEIMGGEDKHMKESVFSGIFFFTKAK